MQVKRILAAIGVGVLTLSAPTIGQQGAPSVTFQTEVNYVDVDAIVTDAQGHFVVDLTKDDFTILEDGKPQKIEMFSPVDIPVQRPDRFAFRDRPIVPDVRTNRQPFDGRIYVIVLDDLDISPVRTAQTIKQARTFVEKYLGANDMAAVIYTSGRSDAAQEFTNDPQLLLAAINKFVGRRMRPATEDKLDQYYNNLAAERYTSEQADSSSSSADPAGRTTGYDTGMAFNTKPTDMLDPTDFERSYRAMGVLSTLKNLSDYLLSVRGRRKAVLMFSEGIDYPVNDPFGSQSASDVLRATQDAITAAAKGNVNYFTIDPRGLVGMDTEFIEMGSTSFANISSPLANGSTSGSNTNPFAVQQDLLTEMRLSQDSLRTLAEETGGFASVSRNSLSFDRIVEANSRYYVMGYYPPTHPRDGRFHRIEVKVKRPGLKVNARKGYASPRGKTPEERKRDEDAQRARAAKNGAANNTSAPLRELLTSPMQQSGLTFSVQAAPFKNTPKAASVALAIEVDGNKMTFAKQDNGRMADNLEFSFYGIGTDGKPQPGTRTEVNLALVPETYNRVRAQGVRINPRIDLPPGRYQVRIGARETGAGAEGTVFYDLQVPDFSKEPLMLGGLLLAAPSSEITPTAQPDPLMAKLMPGAPTSRREFARNDILAIYTELYDNSTSKQPRSYDVTVKLLGEDARETALAHDTLSNTGDAKKWDVFAYSKQFPLSAVAPGRYALQVAAQARGQQDAKPVVRETLITVK
jgi:VWFA-related protein